MTLDPHHRNFERKLALRIALTVAPTLLATALLLPNWQVDAAVRWALFLVILLVTIAGLTSVRAHVLRSMRSVATMLESIRSGEFIHRVRYAQRDDALGDVLVEINLLSQALENRRVEAMQAASLLDKLVAEVDIAVFAFDGEQRLKRLNKAGASLLGAAEETLLGQTAQALGVSTLLGPQQHRVESHVFPSGAGQWDIRYRQFREGGEPHHLLVIADLSRALRAQEREAWRRMVRVMGHEINNSLAPIRSISESLLKSLTAGQVSEEWCEDARRGLDVIRDRSAALSRFISAYAQMTRIPRPIRSPVDFTAIVRQAVSTFDAARVVMEPSPPITVDIDADQMKQVFINLVKNGVEATGQGGEVRIRWRVEAARLVVDVEDDGCGLAASESLWVPLYTTKPSGTGLGLVFSREVVEGHGGIISLENRSDARGCLARIYLPLDECSTQGMESQSQRL